jgi:hypothetical protein
MTTMSESIEVVTDPMSAFSAVTDEYDQWWGAAPSTHTDADDAQSVVEGRCWRDALWPPTDRTTRRPSASSRW